MLFSMTLLDESTKKLIKRTLGMLFDAAKYNLTASLTSKIKKEQSRMSLRRAELEPFVD